MLYDQSCKKLCLVVSLLIRNQIYTCQRDEHAHLEILLIAEKSHGADDVRALTALHLVFEEDYTDF